MMPEGMASVVKGLVARAGGAVSPNSTGAPPQAGVLEGANPTEWNASNPITLFIIQVCQPCLCAMYPAPQYLIGVVPF